MTDAVGTVTQNSYDTGGNRTSTVRDVGTGRINQTTSFTYNARGDPLTLTDARGNVTSSTYDAARRVVTTTTPANLTTAYTYDPAGRVTQTRQLSFSTVLRGTSATYTLSGKPATATDANGNVTTYAYDLLDRRVRITDAVGRVTTFTYDAQSRPTQVFNLLVVGAIPGGALASQTYTLNGLRASLTDAGNHTTAFAYDGLDRLGTTTYPDTSRETLAYDADSNVTSRVTRAGTTLLYGYDTLNRLATKTAAAAPVACSAAASSTPTVTYSYDLAGRLTGVCDNGAAIAAVATPATSTFYTASTSYDAVNRPTGVTYGDVPAATPSPLAPITFSHGYNAVNQRVSQAVSDNSWISYPSGPTTTTGYTANSLNQYTCVGVTAPSCTGVVPTYDNNGNLTSDGTYTLGYDAENRLTSASASGLTAAYAYDARGRRKAKTVNGTTTVFVTDADNRELLEYDGSTGTILRWYAYGLGPNDVLAQTTPGGTPTRSTFIPDLQGSIIGSVSTAGVLTSFAYRPYGGSASAPAQFAYTGQRIDAETGFYYYRARYYSSAWGRFLQTDPSGYVAGALLYAYATNDPLNLLDPYGLNAEGGSWGSRAVDWLADRAAYCLEECYVTSYFTSSRWGLRPGLAGLLAACDALCDPGAYMSVAPTLGPYSMAPSELAASGFSALRAFSGFGRAAESVDIALTYKPSWSAAQIAEADAKVQILNDSETVVTSVNRSGTSARSMFTSAGNEAPVGSDVDHMVDLQLGGSNTLSNLWPLNSSVNRSLGAQIQQQIKGLPVGTVINNVTIGPR